MMIDRRLLMLRLLLLLALCTTTVLADGTSESCSVYENGSCAASESSLKDDKEDACVDTDDRCGHWASLKECEKNPGYMLRNCQKACNVCNTGRSVEELITEAKKKLEDETE